MVLSFERLRERHPELVYEGFESRTLRQDLEVTFHFRLLPDIEFRPTVLIEGAAEFTGSRAHLDTYLFHLGLIESVSYWKAACPQVLRINAGSLTSEQIRWWHDLYLHGLSEFFFRNGIDLSATDLLTIQCGSSGKTFSIDDEPVADGNLILIAGGKDSSLSLELLRGAYDLRWNAFALNPTRSSLDSAKLVGLGAPIIARRTIDPKLIELNKLGYLNGHTPFSAYLAFLSACVGSLFGFSNTITSNERSANEQNVMFKGVPINHQYSKSFRFERMFREYADRYLTQHVHYWSFLRPLHDLQISALFSRYPLQLFNFRSCNVNQRLDSWCGECPKCAFVYLSLYPFVERTMMYQIFGGDLFERPRIVQFISELIGLSSVKPFECVGSVAESRAALSLAVHRMKGEGRQIPAGIEPLFNALPPGTVWARELLSEWNSEHFLPSWAEAQLRHATEFLGRI